MNVSEQKIEVFYLYYHLLIDVFNRKNVLNCLLTLLEKFI